MTFTFGCPELDTNVTFVNVGPTVELADVVFVVWPYTRLTVEKKVTLATSLAVLPSKTAVTRMSCEGSPGPPSVAMGMAAFAVQVTTVGVW